MRVTFESKVFVCHCKYEERNLPRQNGFKWNPHDKRWYTANFRVAARLRNYCDESAVKALNTVLLQRVPWSGAISFPPTKKPRPYQIEAAKYALSQNRSYLALPPGSGKTPTAAMISNTLQWATVYLTPPFLLGNVQNEFKEWRTQSKAPFLLVTDSRIHNTAFLNKIILSLENFKSRGFPVLLIVDEAHRFKTESAKRTRSLLDFIHPHADKVVYMSGTPTPNYRPMELYPILSASAPEIIDFRNKFQFGMHYCSGYKSNWGYDFTGASNLDEFNKKVYGPFIFIKNKEEILGDLPEKTRQVVLLDKKLPEKLLSMDMELIKSYSPEDLMKNQIGEEHFATYRKELALAKTPMVSEYVEYILENDPKEQILLFGIHFEALMKIANDLKRYNPLTITGKTPMQTRQEIVDKFQNGETRLLLLNIQAGGVGFNLTKATRVLFAEYSYVPGENIQAEDRAHRIGQKSNLLVQYIVYRNSIDALILESLFRKQETKEKLEK